MRFNSVSPEIRQKMERIREETGKTLTEIFEEAIKEYQG
jgi:predicted DNA-binding protein